MKWTSLIRGEVWGDGGGLEGAMFGERREGCWWESEDCMKGGMYERERIDGKFNTQSKRCKCSWNMTLLAEIACNEGRTFGIVSLDTYSIYITFFSQFLFFTINQLK